MARAWVCASLMIAFALPLLASAETIAEGQTRTVQGKLTAIDVVHRSVLLEVSTPKEALTVGVTLKDSVEPTLNGKPAALPDLQAGEKATLTYTRTGDQLIGLNLKVKR